VGVMHDPLMNCTDYTSYTDFAAHFAELDLVLTLLFRAPSSGNNSN